MVYVYAYDCRRPSLKGSSDRITTTTIHTTPQTASPPGARATRARTGTSLRSGPSGTWPRRCPSSRACFSSRAWRAARGTPSTRFGGVVSRWSLAFGLWCGALDQWMANERGLKNPHSTDPHDSHISRTPPSGNFDGAKHAPIRTGRDDLDKRVVYSPHIYGPEVFRHHRFVRAVCVFRFGGRR